MMDKMDEEKKTKMMEELEKMGITKDMVDERLMWGAKKMMFGMMKVRWSLKENGMDEEKAKETVKKMVDKMMEMDMMEKMGKNDKMKGHQDED